MASEIKIVDLIPEMYDSAYTQFLKCCEQTKYLMASKSERLSLGFTSEKYGSGMDKAIFKIAAVEGNKIIGQLMVNTNIYEREKHYVTFGINILEEYHGKGIGTLMMERLLKYFAESEYVKLKCEVISNNKNAIKMYEKLGFIFEARLKKEVKIDNNYYDVLVYSIIKEI